MQQRAVAVTVAAYAAPSKPAASPTARMRTLCAGISVPPHPRWARATKRMIDVVASATLMIALLPLLLLVAIAIRLSSSGPVIFAQTRCGRGGAPFLFFKFRSMVTDAETRKHALLHLNEVRGAAFKIARDPRVTRLGRVLRKYSIDELPQLWNVLIGDMSLVGPRPPMPIEVATYTDRQIQRLAVVPGITGLWQVSGRSTITTFDRWVELDLAYIERWSLWLDLRILARTLPVVLRAQGSC